MRKAITEKDGIYFNFYSTNWLPLFKICNAYDTVYYWFCPGSYGDANQFSSYWRLQNALFPTDSIQEM